MTGNKKKSAAAFAAAAVLAAAVLFTGQSMAEASEKTEAPVFSSVPQRGEIVINNSRKDKVFDFGHGDDFVSGLRTGSVSFAAVGDNLIHSGIYSYVLGNLGGDFSCLYDGIRDYISAADVAIINHETMLVEDPGEISGYPAFGTPIQVGDAVIGAGFDVVSCATNHCMDKGGYGATVTRQFYRDRGIACLGIQSYDETDYIPYQIVEKNGLRIAFFNYTYGTNGYPIPDENPYMAHTLDNEDRVRADLAAGCADSDIQIVCVHMGDEYEAYPNDYQNHWISVFMEYGVDVCLGSHPHVLQPYGVIEGDGGRKMLVYYSLGNFISCQIEEDCQIGGMALFTLEKDGRGTRIVSFDRMKTRTLHDGNNYYYTILSET